MSHVGIDLGTTFSAISYLDEIGNPSVVPIREGDRICPSLVYKNGEGNFKVGQIAASMAEAEPENVAGNFKRNMPTGAEISLGGDTFTPVEMSSMILKKLKDDFESNHGPITSAAITIPANWQDAGRRATMEAAKRAGLPAEHIINEPTAAIFAIVKRTPLDGTVLVYDLGGGTFDVTIAKVKGSEINVLASCGDDHLGGRDFDCALLADANKKFEHKHGTPLVDNEDINGIEFRRHQHKFETAKKNLSILEKAEVVLNKKGFEPFIYTVTRAEFEGLINTYLTKADQLVDVVVDDAKLTHDDIDKIVLVGGSTRIPDIQKRIFKMFGKNPITSNVNVDECVCLGAAIYAGLKAPQSSLNAAQQSALQNVFLTDVTPAFFGTLAWEGDSYNLKNSIILRKNMPLPCESINSFYTVHQGQEAVECKITQSGYEEEDADMVEVVGAVKLQLPRGRPANQEITARYSYDENGIMHCEFKDVSTGSFSEYKYISKCSEGVDAANTIDLDDFIID